MRVNCDGRLTWRAFVRCSGLSNLRAFPASCRAKVGPDTGKSTCPTQKLHIGYRALMLARGRYTSLGLDIVWLILPSYSPVACRRKLAWLDVSHA